jgi:hypothetical protein
MYLLWNSAKEITCSSSLVFIGGIKVVVSIAVAVLSAVVVSDFFDWQADSSNKMAMRRRGYIKSFFKDIHNFFAGNFTSIRNVVVAEKNYFKTLWNIHTSCI